MISCRVKFRHYYGEMGTPHYLHALGWLVVIPVHILFYFILLETQTFDYSPYYYHSLTAYLHRKLWAECSMFM